MGEAIADITHWASQRSLKGCHEEKGTILRWSRPHKQSDLEGLSTVCVYGGGGGGWYLPRLQVGEETVKKKQEGGIKSDWNILYRDFSGGYISIHICQKS